MIIELDRNPLHEGRIQYIVDRHVNGRGFLNWFGWYSWLVFGLLGILFIGTIVYPLALSGWNWSQLGIIEWVILIWLISDLPRFFKLLRYWITSKGASTMPKPPLINGYNSGKLKVEMSEAGIKLTSPMIVENIDWKAINTVFEQRQKIYLAACHNPIVVLPATDETRTFLKGLGYSLTK